MDSSEPPETDPIRDSLGFERVEWRLSRLGWIIMTLVVLAGLVGVFGDGPLSEARSTSSNGRLELTYSRIIRNQGLNQLEVRWDQDAEEPTRLRISQDFLVSNQLVAINPPPTTSFAQGGDMIYEFPSPGPRGHASEQHSVGSLKVRIDLRPTGGPGTRHATISVDESFVHISQFAFP